MGGGNKDYIKQFPAGQGRACPFDVVFLGDVGVEDGQLTTEHDYLRLLFAKLGTIFCSDLPRPFERGRWAK